MEGFLTKQETTLFGRKIWKKRWVVIDKNTLKYYKTFDFETKKPFREKGSIDICNCETSLVVKSNYPEQCFLMKDGGKLFYFSALNHEDLNNWLRCIQLNNKLNSNSQDISSKRVPACGLEDGNSYQSTSKRKDKVRECVSE
jgi:hypothetical protein